MGSRTELTYECEVAAIGSAAEGAWTAAATAVAPMGRPDAPGKPSVEALGPLGADQRHAGHRAGRVRIPIPMFGRRRRHVVIAGRGGIGRYDCADRPSDERRAIRLPGLRRECGRRERGIGPVRCRHALRVLPRVQRPAPADRWGSSASCSRAGCWRRSWRCIASGPAGTSIAVVDVIHSVNLGGGSRLGIDFVRDPDTRAVTGVVPLEVESRTSASANVAGAASR